MRDYDSRVTHDPARAVQPAPVPFERPSSVDTAHVVYSAAPVRGRTYGIVAGILGLIAVVPPVVGGRTGSLGEFATNAAAYAATLGIPLWIALITLWSVNRYGRIVLTRERLRVGRHELPVAALDAAAAREVALDKKGPLPPVVPGRVVRHMGGAWDTPMGLEPVVLALVDGSAVVVDVKDRPGFLTALRSVLV